MSYDDVRGTAGPPTVETGSAIRVSVHYRERISATDTNTIHRKYASRPSSLIVAKTPAGSFSTSAVHPSSAANPAVAPIQRERHKEKPRHTTHPPWSWEGSHCSASFAWMVLASLLLEIEKIAKPIPAIGRA